MKKLINHLKNKTPFTANEDYIKGYVDCIMDVEKFALKEKPFWDVNKKLEDIKNK